MTDLKMLTILAAALLLLCSSTLVQAGQKDFIQDSPYAWTCRNKNCIKVDASQLQAGERGLPMDVCKLNCDSVGVLWPKPTGTVNLGPDFVGFYPQNIVIRNIEASSPENKATVEKQIAIFVEYLLQSHPQYKNDGVSPFPVNSNLADEDLTSNYLVLDIQTLSEIQRVKLGNDESYALTTQVDPTLKNVTVSIVANSIFGSRHALETLSRLIAYDETSDSLRTLDSAEVTDSPVYAYRGLSLDTARNYFPVSSLKRIIDGLSMSKLNMLHWHITDTHSFPFYSKSVPQMSQYGAYTPAQIYSPEDIAELVEYARIRAVKIIPEFDAPAHAGNGWEWGPAAGLGEMALCINKEPWGNYADEPPAGQLNPINANMYDIVGKIYGDMMELFDGDIFHMGGDEVKLRCWLENEEITNYFTSQGMENNAENLIALWAEFQSKVYELLLTAVAANNGTAIKAESTKAILWTSELASVANMVEYLDAAKYIIQIWSTGSDPVVGHIIKNGYQAIFSNVDAWYMDCGYGSWVGGIGNNWCSPYKSWQSVYDNNPLELLKQQLTSEEIQTAFDNGQILGGEAALWTESVGVGSVESKLWPRLSALGERLWSNPQTSWSLAETRMLQENFRLVQRGIQADLLEPLWCNQNENLCY